MTHPIFKPKDEVELREKFHVKQSPVNNMLQEAAVYIKSGLLPYSIKTPEQAVLIMMKGKELGIQPLEALSSINVIQGKPTISPQLMLGLARKAGQLEDLVINYEEDETCVCTVKRKGQSAYTERFGPVEAKSMKLSGKDNYQKQAKTMYKWRALSAALRVAFADIVTGIYTHEEMAPDGKYDDDGIPVENMAEIKVIKQEHGDDVAEMAERGKSARDQEIKQIQEDPTSIAEINDEHKVGVNELRKRIVNALLEINHGDKEEAINHLELISEFDAKDGTAVPGVRSTKDLKDKRLRAVYGKVKRIVAEYRELNREGDKDE